MRVLDGELVLSPSDLTGFAACSHLTYLDGLVAGGALERPARLDDPLLDVLSRRGGEHEAGILAEYEGDGSKVISIAADTKTRAGLEEAATATEQAMRDGADVIYQATFFHDGWVGHADFLHRVDIPSPHLGGWSYEVSDAKLARTVKPAALVQLCSYSEHVERIQGNAPEHVHVLTGDGTRHSFRLTSLGAYYRSLRDRLVAAVRDGIVGTYPEPVGHCAVCRWRVRCEQQRRSDDHLSLVAGMRRDQTGHLEAVGVATRGALAASASGASVDGIGAATFERLRTQAALQVKGDGALPPLHELLVPEIPDQEGPERGFAALPEPSPGDLFLDLEGDPYAFEGGLEYLFGIVELVDGKPVYHPFWGHTRAEERIAFEAVIDLISDRRAKDPDLHVYHYAAYEASAIRRLMGQHGAREIEVDELLRSEALVDLYQVVRQSVRLSTESYSLKKVERLYLERAPNEVMDGGSSIVTYEEYLVDGDQHHLDEIEAYNRDDCESLVGLREWFEARRVEAEQEFGPIPRPAVRDGAAALDLAAWELAAAELVERVRAGVPLESADRDEEQRARWLLGDLVHWHRREAKPAWWMFFHRVRDMDEEEFLDDPECIGGLTYEGVVGSEKQSTIYRYRFEPQDHKFGVDATPVDPATADGAGTVVLVDDAEGIIDLKRGNRSSAPHPNALVPGGPFNDKVQREAIVALAEWVADHGVDGAGEWSAGRDLLLGRSPRFVGNSDGPSLACDGEAPLDAARRIVPLLDESCLAIQGPPGAGKTYTGAEVIVDLVEAGKRVGVTALSHAAIGNLLRQVHERAAMRGVKVAAIQKADGEQHCGIDSVECTGDNARVEAAILDDEVDLVAGTAWLWARKQMRKALDVLVIDEAGQLSLANVLAVSGAARNLLLLGDPQQLAQPSQASHPEGADVSALEHLLGDHQTIPPELGLFLDSTFRMHPSVCSFISEVIYEGRLHSVPGLEYQAVGGDSGLHFVPVAHEGNRTASSEEAMAVHDLVASLVGMEWRNRDDECSLLTLDDILVVAPYNAHVACLRRHLSDGTRIGTVDKFQGQEAPVTVYSMASSSPDDAPRGMSFLYDLHRLNVAVSRARALSIVVASPALLKVLCSTADQVPLANAVCRFHELATDP